MSSKIQHIAIIPDGNGRWASKHNKVRTQGHYAGAKSILKSIYDLIDLEIPYVTYFTFSTENWTRPSVEVGFLMSLLKEHIEKETKRLFEKKISIQFIGRYEGLDTEIVRLIKEVSAKEIKNPSIRVYIAFNYGGRAEIVDCFKRLIRKVQTQNIDVSQITEKDISQNLYIPDSECPDPDFIWRSSGEKRLSNFLLWQSAYSEYITDDFLWPDYKKDYLEKAMALFYKRGRRFGSV